MKNQSGAIKTNLELYRVVMGGSGGYSRLTGGSAHFSLHTHKHCIIIYISTKWSYTTPTLPQALPLHGNKREREKGKRSPSLTKTMKSHMKSCVAYQYHSYEKNMAQMLKTVGQKNSCQQKYENHLLSIKAFEGYVTFPISIPTIHNSYN